VGEKVIDGYRGINVNVSVMEKLKVLKDVKGLGSYNNAVKWLLDHQEKELV